MFCCSFGSRHVLLRGIPGVFHCSFCFRHTSVPATTLERISSSDLSLLCRRGVKATQSCGLHSPSVYLLYIQKQIVFPIAEKYYIASTSAPTSTSSSSCSYTTCPGSRISVSTCLSPSFT